MRKTLFALAFLVVVVAAISSADAVFLIDKEVVFGTVVEIRNQLIVVETDGGSLEIPIEEVEKVEYSERFARLRSRNATLEIRAPYYSIVEAASGNLWLCLVGQTALTRRFALASSAQFVVGNGVSCYSLILGPELHTDGDYLQGLFLGLQPGVTYCVDGPQFIVNTEFGYQWLYESGTVFGLVAGVVFSATEQELWTYTTLQVGFAFKHPWIRAR